MENFVGSSLNFPEHPHFHVLIEMFPDICPNYLRKLCLGKEETEETLEDLTTELLNGNYKRIQRPLTKFEVREAIRKHQTLIQLLPDADPVYLMDKVKRLISDLNALNQFVDELMEKRNYPLKSEYLKNIELREEEEKYIKKFDIEYFLKNIPNPEKHFEKKKLSYDNSDDYFYALTYLKNKYRFLHVKEIIKTFDQAKNSVIEASNILESKKIPTAIIEEPMHHIDFKNISLLQEIAYVENKSDILDHIKLQNEQSLRAKKRAEEAGFFCTCECCFNDEVTPYDIVSCQSGHVFCSSCVQKSCEVIIGEGKIDFPCLTVCNSQFSLRVLQCVLPQKMFSKMAQRKQLEEVRQAEIEGLVFCSFCDFATILSPDNNIIQCLNEECKKETCRLCQRVSHIPFTCQEIERQVEEKQRADQQETRNRTYIEERMTEALLRTCQKCSKSFLKESGCNKMTCPCGAIMCYVCKQSIIGYNHFTQSGGRCPLYSNTKTLHRNQVQQGAQRAKQDLGNVKLKFDPSKNV